MIFLAPPTIRGRKNEKGEEMGKWIIGVIAIVIVVLPLYCSLVVAKKGDEEIERFFQNDGKKN